jgi:hypothetical protein
MKTTATTLLVATATITALPASAKAPVKPVAQPVSLSSDELPLTNRFASMLTSYRNCVLAEVEASPLGVQQQMAREAMSACAISRGELRAQLISDIREKQPKLGNAVALRSAEEGLAQVDPMIEQAAIDWAHKRYARSMY